MSAAKTSDALVGATWGVDGHPNTTRMASHTACGDTHRTTPGWEMERGARTPAPDTEEKRWGSSSSSSAAAAHPTGRSSSLGGRRRGTRAGKKSFRLVFTIRFGVPFGSGRAGVTGRPLPSGRGGAWNCLLGSVGSRLGEGPPSFALVVGRCVVASAGPLSKGAMGRERKGEEVEGAEAVSLEGAGVGRPRGNGDATALWASGGTCGAARDPPRGQRAPPALVGEGVASSFRLVGWRRRCSDGGSGQR